MEKKNRPIDLICVAAYGFFAVFWFVKSFLDAPNGGAVPLPFGFGIAFGILFCLSLRRCWRNRRKKS